MNALYSLLLSIIGGTVSDWVKSRSEIAEQVAKANVERLKNGIPGYSDEFLVLVWAYPFIASFVPFLQPSVGQGFEFMAALPDWYITGFGFVSAAVFGIDKWLIVRGKKSGAA